MNWFQKLFNLGPGTTFYPDTFSRIISPSPQFNDYKDSQIIEKAFSNPAFLKVIALQCDLFSIAKLYVYKDGKDLDNPDHPALKNLEKPNFFQSQQQFLWDYMFWLMIGNAYLYSYQRTPGGDILYFLDPTRMEFPNGFERRLNKIILSKKSYNDLMDTYIKYKNEDSTEMTIKLKDIISISDLSNGTGNWLKGNSRVTALKKVIDNIEEILDSTNINMRYSGKYLVAGKQDPERDMDKVPLTNEEKLSIEETMNGPKKVHGLKSMIEIKRFVENIGNLKLTETYQHQYFIIGSMFGIPQDVLEAYLKSSTFENQEKAIGRHVIYTMQPKGDDLMNRTGNRWQLPNGERLVISWDHLPFMQIFERDRMSHKTQQINTFKTMLNMGIPIEEINSFLDTNFSNAKLEQPTGKKD